jgi:hypothetical protein
MRKREPLLTVMALASVGLGVKETWLMVSVLGSRVSPCLTRLIERRFRWREDQISAT